MNVVDSSGWLEYFADGPNADAFAAPIESVDDLLVPTLSMYEVFRRVAAQRDEQSALEAIALMRQGLVIPLTAELAIEAARLSLEMRLPMADSIMLASAREYEATLWTQDADFAAIEDVHYLPKRTS